MKVVSSLLLLACMAAACALASPLLEALRDPTVLDIPTDVSPLDFTEPFLFLPDAAMKEFGADLAVAVTGSFGPVPMEGFLFISEYKEAGSESDEPEAYSAWQNYTSPPIFAIQPFYGVSYLKQFSYPQASLTSYVNETCDYVFTEEIRCTGWVEEGAETKAGIKTEVYTNLCSIWRLDTQPQICGTMDYSVRLDSETSFPMENNCTVVTHTGFGPSRNSTSTEVIQFMAPVEASHPAVQCVLAPGEPVISPPVSW